jgi:hypothetical protein
MEATTRSATSSISTQQIVDALSDGLKNKDRVLKAIKTFQSLVQATSNANSDAYKKFAKSVVR